VAKLKTHVSQKSQNNHASITPLPLATDNFNLVNDSRDTTPQSNAERQTSMGRRILARSAASHDYTVRLATSPEDVRAAQTLRFLVFNLELEEGLEESYLTLRDEDLYDVACDHLLVECNGEVVGTYRMQTGDRAAQHSGFYSAQEFDLTPFEPIRAQVLELGRACVHSEHRNLRVLSMLWRGIANYARDHGCRYLLGCSSLTSQDAEEGIALYEMLSRKHLAPTMFCTLPLPQWVCPPPLVEREPAPVPRAPKLLTAYLSLGAKICAPPALDREFKTIDFLTLLDLQNLPASAVQLLQ
jgi:putative hemolysin